MTPCQVKVCELQPLKVHNPSLLHPSPASESQPREWEAPQVGQASVADAFPDLELVLLFFAPAGRLSAVGQVQGIKQREVSQRREAGV